MSKAPFYIVENNWVYGSSDRSINPIKIKSKKPIFREYEQFTDITFLMKFSFFHTEIDCLFDEVQTHRY